MADKILVNYEGNVQPLIDALKKVEAEQAKVDASAKKTSDDIGKGATDAAKKVDGLGNEIKKTGTEAEQAGKKAKKAFDETGSHAGALNKTITKIGIAIAGAFAVDKLIAFGKEAAELARKAVGVERAFERLNNPQLLGQLQKATKGLVSDLNLMTAAVRAKNFQIPLEQLPKLFEFAQRRAQETGESVDYLVESIILGIGRKSPLILDNLGISAVRLRENFKGTSVEVANVGDVARVVGNIVNEELAGMGENAQLAGDSIAQLGVKWENLKTKIGSSILSLADGIALAFDPTLLNNFTQRLDGLDETLDNSEVPIQNFATAISAVNKSIEEGDKGVLIMSQNASTVELSTEKMKLFFDQLQKQIGAIDDVANRLSRYNVESKTFGEIQQDNFIVQDRLFAAQEKARKGIEDVTKSVKDGSMEFVEGELRIKGYELEIAALNEALVNTENAFKKIFQSFKASSAESNSGAVTLKALKETVTNLKEELESLEIGSTDYNTTLGLLKKATADYEAANERLNASLGKTKQTEQEIIDARIKALKETLAETNRQSEGDEPNGPPDNQKEIEAATAALKKLNEGKSEQTEQDIENGRLIKEAADKAYNDNLKRLDKEEKDREEAKEKAIQREKDKQQVIKETFELAMALSNALADIENNRLEKEAMSLEANKEAQLEAIDKELSAKNISEKRKEDLIRQRDELEAESASKLAEIRKKQAINDKAAAIFNIIISTAQSIMEALKLAPPAGEIIAGIRGAIGAAQIAVVASQPIPQFAKGVVDLNGPGTGTSDSITARLSKGESVIPAAQTKKHRSALEALHGDYFDKYVNTNHVLPALKEYDRAMNVKKGKDLAENIAASLNLHNIFKDGNIVYELKRGRWNGEANTDKIVKAIKKTTRRKQPGKS